MGLTMFGDCYAGRRVLLTGHTGFKGSWLALWLQRLGAEVTGIALPATTSPSHWELLRIGVKDYLIDIRNLADVRAAVDACQPEIVFHLAAQPLVRRSYADPLETWSTNVMGTAHVLDACRRGGSARAIVIATSDKCYENREWLWPYRESDRLGGHDPYSASKAATEILAASWRASFLGDGGALLATVRAGNVIGGGDWADDRLVPDLARAVAAGVPAAVRRPASTRPWQHVLEPLSGYLLVGQRLLERHQGAAAAWNFGPGPDGNATVAQLLEELARHWPDLRWTGTDASGPHEAGRLQLDSSKAHAELNWRPVWSLPKAAQMTADWYARHTSGTLVSTNQLDEYIISAAAARIPWALS